MIKKLLLILLLIVIDFTAIQAQTADSKYDSVLAKKLNADGYGMKNYILVLLKPGSNTSASKATEDSIFHGHLNNITRLANTGELVLAGPFGKNDLYRGLFVLNVTSFDAARKLLETDPAIKAKVLEPEMYLWYGSASLQELTKIHQKIQKLKF
jgi:uncharacterized protein YciI